jgi:histidinol-phosphate/aromatic aminotransferase/cobyric acid decarboxylase-like protein
MTGRFPFLRTRILALQSYSLQMNPFAALDRLRLDTRVQRHQPPIVLDGNHQMWLTMLGVGINIIPAFRDGVNHPSVEDAAAAIDANTRAIVLCTPNNPTGAIYPPDVLAAFYDLAQSRGLALILDETHKDFRPDTTSAHDLFNRPEWDETLIQLYSFSKVYALAALLGNNEQAVALWEKGKVKVPAWADRLMRALYREHMGENAQIRKLIETVASLETKTPQPTRFEARETAKGWTLKAA